MERGSQILNVASGKHRMHMQTQTEYQLASSAVTVRVIMSDLREKGRWAEKAAKRLETGRDEVYREGHQGTADEAHCQKKEKKEEKTKTE